MAVREAFPVLILGVIGTLARVGAQSATPDPAQAVRTFRFVATDAKGQPVTDLRPDEVQVSDGGKHDRLAFSRLLLPALPAPAALGPREFSNRAGGQLATSTLILIDLFNASFTEHSTAWDQTIQTLEKLESSENVFLFLVAPDASLFAIHAPGAPTEPPSGPWTRQIRDLLDQGLRTVEKLKHADSADADVIASLTDQALKTLGAQYAALPGQKRLIWVTRGMPLTVIGPNGPLPLVFQPLLQQTAEEYRQLGIQIYTVHQKESNTSNVDRAKALDSLAPLTGGRSFEDEAVGRAIAEAQTDARAAYEAGYYTNDKDADGKLHKLRVSTTRKGARILAADGYTAEPLETIEERALGLVEARPFDTPDIGLRVSFETSGEAAHFQIHVDRRDLLLQPAGSSQTGKLFLAFVYSNADGQRTATEPVSSKVTLTPDQFDAAMKDGYSVTVDQALPAGTTKVRIVVQDAATGIAGSLSIPIR